MMRRVAVTILQRMVLGLLTLLLVSVLIFASVELLPGGYAEAVLGQAATPETVKVLNQELGLDRSPAVRYVEWIGNVLKGDLGYSYAGADGRIKRSVTGLIAPRMLNTFFLGGFAAILSVPLAIVLGLLCALYRDGWFDRLVNSATLITIALPEFFVAYVLMFFFAIKLRWFYILSTVGPSTPFSEHIVRAALPAATLALVVLAHMMRMTRASIVTLLARSYIEMARLKGLPPSRIIFKHALRNAWGPIATVVAFNLAYLITGVVVVEVVFVYPGIGQLMVDAVSSRDMPVVQACALIFAATYIVLNLLADIVSIVTNPRLLYPR